MIASEHLTHSFAPHPDAGQGNETGCFAANFEEQERGTFEVLHSWENQRMPDIEITCAECGNAFPFTEREQEYYQERNLTHPKRCKPCRDARRSNFGASRGGGGERERFEITCDQCGKQDTVPFKPSSGRPVLCGECFSANRAAQKT